MKLLFVLSLCLWLASFFVQPASAWEPISLEKNFATKVQTHKATGKKYAIVSQGKATTAAGQWIINQGGNVIDAACAMSFVIGVERPHSTGIGGGGFMMIKRKGAKTEAVDFRETAPLKASVNMYLDKSGEVIRGKSLKGVHANAVPGLVAGVYEVHQKYGKLSWDKILQPAINLASGGFPIYRELGIAMERNEKLIHQYHAAKKIFTDKGRLLTKGENLRQSDLGKTLKLIAQKGRDGFYKGEVAQAIVAEHQRLGGLIQQRDLDKYQVIWRKPVSGNYLGYQIQSMPPPSSGGVHVLQILKMLQPLHLEKVGPYAAQTIHRTASAMQLAFADRALHMGDPDFVAVPTQEILSEPYLKKRFNQVPAKKKIASSQIKGGTVAGKESSETTHFTVMDHQGNVVSSTQTINGWLGSVVVIPGTGIIMNNEMDDFSAKEGAANLFGAIGSKMNAIQPGKRPLSSMSPTIVLKKGKPVLALGSPAGTRIISCVAQTLMNVLEYKMPLYQSVVALRYHHQWQPDKIRVEPPGFPADVTKKLTAMGHEIYVKPLGCKVAAIQFENGVLTGVADPRGEGAALAL
ncbi:MAG: gamma-glutamyltransferase [Zetaproteobacteria bacterium]|nr:gamma-glutamyltransferase [Pseudobdellovibrionaceae bacterium]